MRSIFRLLSLILLLGLSSSLVFAATPNKIGPKPNPVLRLPPLNLGCAAGQIAECYCTYVSCQGPNGPAGGPAGGFKLCGDVNGSGGTADLQDCIDAAKEMCNLQGYPGVYGYDCFDNSESPIGITGYNSIGE